MNRVKTIDDALEILNKAKEEYGNLPITIVTFTENTNCLDIQYDENEITFYNY